MRLQVAGRKGIMPRMADAQGDSAHPHPSLGGYDAWIISRLADERGEKHSTVAGWIIGRWIEANKALLEEEYGITRQQFRESKAAPPVKKEPNHGG
jgi:hypothetical protein